MSGGNFEDIENRLDDLERQLQSIDDTHTSRWKRVISPRLDDLEDASDDARSERAELGATLQDLKTQVAQLQTRVQDLRGVDSKEESNPQKRVRDVRDAMIERADARGESGGYARIQLWRGEIEDMLTDLGHGDWSRPVYQKVLQDLAEQPGFEKTKKENADGREVDAVAVDTDELRSVLPRSDPTTRKPGSSAEIGGESALSASQD